MRFTCIALLPLHSLYSHSQLLTRFQDLTFFLMRNVLKYAIVFDLLEQRHQRFDNFQNI